MSLSLSAGRPCDVAVIGAGFSGTLLAIQLARQSDGNLTLALIEKRDRFARGDAGSTRPSGLTTATPLRWNSRNMAKGH